MTTIKPETVLHIAALARLHLSSEEVEKYSEQLSDILAWVEQLEGAKSETVEPTNQVTDSQNVSRVDEVRAGSPEQRKTLIEQMPERDEDGLRVPVVLAE